MGIHWPIKLSTAQYKIVEIDYQEAHLMHYSTWISTPECKVSEERVVDEKGVEMSRRIRGGVERVVRVVDEWVLWYEGVEVRVE